MVAHLYPLAAPQEQQCGLCESDWASVFLPVEWEQRSSACLARPTGHSLLTIQLLDAPKVILGQLEVVGVHPLVAGRHDSAGVIRVLQAQ